VHQGMLHVPRFILEQIFLIVKYVGKLLNPKNTRAMIKSIVAVVVPLLSITYCTRNEQNLCVKNVVLRQESDHPCSAHLIVKKQAENLK